MAAWRAELDDYRDVLMGRQAPPINNGVLSLMEVADAYLSRAREIEQLILRGESQGTILKGGAQYKFRTGELRSFIEMAKGACDLGSRRVTAAKMEFDMAD